MNNSKRFVFGVVLVWSAILSLFALLRLVAPSIGIDQNAFGLFANLVNFSLFVLISSILIISLCTNMKVNNYHYFFILVVCYGCSVGLVYRPINFDYVKHFYVLLFSLIFFYLGRINTTSWSFGKLKKYFHFSILCNLLAVILFYILSKFFFIYPGFGTQSVAYVLFYFMVAGNRGLAWISFFILVSQGKRGILFSVLFSIFIYLFIKKIKSRSLLILGLFGFVFIITGLMYLIEFYNLYNLPGLARIVYINPFSSRFDLFIGSSGRLDEFLSVYKVMAALDYSFLFGGGFGFNYEWTLSYREGFSEIKSYLHNSPMMLYILAGPVLMLFFYTYSMSFLTFILSKTVNSNTSESKYAAFFAISSIFFLISGLFSLNILSDSLGWMCMGVSSGIYFRIKNEVEFHKRVK